MSNLVKQKSAINGLEFNREQIELIKDTVAKGATDNELAMFLHIAKTYGLDPLVKELFFLKYGTAAATIITGRDGYLKIANARPEMDGIQSDSVCKNDLLTKKPDGTVDHSYGSPERGPVIGAYALVFRKDRSRAAYFYAPMAEYNAGSNPTWKKYPTAMIIKVAEACALKRAFSISGLVTQEEMDVSQESQWQPAQVQPAEAPPIVVQLRTAEPEPSTWTLDEHAHGSQLLRTATSVIELRERFATIPKPLATALKPLAREIAATFDMPTAHE